MQKGLSPNATTRLPLGNPLHGFAIALEIEIIDALGAGTLDILVVMVTMTSFNTPLFPFQQYKVSLKLQHHTAQEQTIIFLRGGRVSNFSEQVVLFSVGSWKNFCFRFAVLRVLPYAIFSCLFYCSGIIFWLLAYYDSPPSTKTANFQKLISFSSVTENNSIIPELSHIFLFEVPKRKDFFLVDFKLYKNSLS